MYFTSTAPKPPREDRRSVTFVFRHSSWQHCAGVNALVASPDGAALWTGSRDSLIKRWRLGEGQDPSLDADFEGHCDWVNALALVGDGDGGGDLLLSASSDRTLRLWRAGGAGPALSCLCGHSDYVTSLAVAPGGARTVASGGLGAEVLTWDLAAAAPAAKIDGVRGSVYSLAADASGLVLAAGTAAGVIWLADPRSGRAEAALRGHGDTVRALAMRADGGALVSGSSDRTLRSWDLRQRRATATLAVHADSVWALAPGDEGLDAVFSGGRDGCVYRTHLASKVAEAVADEGRPVGALAGGAAGAPLWVATTSSTVRCWRLGPEDDGGRATRSSAAHPRHAFVAGALPAVRARAALGGAPPGARPPLRPGCAPAAAIPGVPPVRHVAVLTNRRHVLTQDEEGSVLLWDLTAGAPVEALGKVPLAEAERARFDPAHNVWPWFQPDTRLGCLAGVMAPPACFMAEAYRRDLGDAAAPADAKVNMAQYMVGALFKGWAEARGAEVVHMAGEASPTAAAAAAAEGGGDAHMADAREGGGAGVAPAPGVGPIPAFHLRSELAPVVMVEGGGAAAPWRRAVDAFDGSEAEGQAVPPWVADCVLRRHIPPGKDLKMAFVLVPSAASGLPSLLQSRLNAPRVLSIDKVADYVMRKMAEQGVALAEEPLFWSPQKQALWEEEQRRAAEAGAADDGVQGGSPSSAKSAGEGSVGSASAAGGLSSYIGIRQLRPVAPPAPPAPAPPLLITCGGAAVPWDFTLAAVRQWLWKRPEDLRLEYGVREAGTELRVPTIRPPS